MGKPIDLFDIFQNAPLMVSVSKLRDDLTESLQDHIRRVYPLIQGPERWGALTDQRDDYFSNPTKFNLVQEPLLEAIPQYAEGENSKPSDMKNWKTLEEENLTKKQKERLEILGSILKTSGVNYNLYPHQKEAILANLEGRDVVVATGTGSGKTESFLFPVLNHLIDEAIRTDGKPSERAVKAMVLYPMNALVADQMARMRELFGNPKIATILQNKGYGRFPQFGMYTGRSPFHGWYANPSEDKDGNPTWVRRKTETKMTKYMSPFKESQKDKSLWESLGEKGKIPSIGGKLCFRDGQKEEETLHFDQLPKYVQRTLLKPENRDGRTLDEVRDSRFYIDEKQEIFDRMNKQDGHQKDTPDHLRFVGDGLDRELIARHQMHLGGIRQYISHKYPKAPLDDVMNGLGVGIPDILVTNYSMLEYMLMRPMEHIFWHKTSEWLEGDEDAKLLLVIDEAHLYEGAMGTEFTLLLNRLLSVLLPNVSDMEAARNKIQFIITSASLGTDNQAAKGYANGLLSLSGNRAERLWLPNTQLKGFQEVTNEDQKISNKVRDSMNKASENLSKNKSNKSEIEINLMKEIIGADKVAKIILESKKISIPEEALRRHRLAKMIEEWPAAHRLRRLLLRRKTLSEKQSNDLDSAYIANNLSNPGSDDERLPRRYGLVRHFLFEEDAGSDKALDLMLDLIAAAHAHGSRLPFLPIRMHMFTRGDTKSRICPKCGSIWADGKERCTCGSLIYELYFDRNCGGAYIRLWWSSPGIRGTNSSTNTTTPDLNVFDFPARAWNSRNLDPDTNEDEYHGILARVLDDDSDPNECPEHAKNALLNTQDGSVIEFDSIKLKQDNFVFIQIMCRGGLRRFRWEEKEGYVDPRECTYCSRNYSRNQFTNQFSDTETRGDQFFSGLVSTCTSKLDPVPDSKHAHEGRKMLLFSDGRQRAARLARDLKSAQSVDQGRAMFVHMHNLSWFMKIPEKNRTLAKLYPYLCIMSAKSRANPLSDTERKPSRSRMTEHTNLLLAFLCEEYEAIIGDLNTLPGGWPEFDLDDEYEEMAKLNIQGAIRVDLWKWKRILDWFDDTDAWKENLKNLWKKVTAARKKFFQDHDSWSKLTEDNPIFGEPDEIGQIISTIQEFKDLKTRYPGLPGCGFDNVKSTIESLREVNENRARILLPFARKRWLMDHVSISHIDFAQEASKKLIKALDKEFIDPTDFSEKCNYWIYEIQANSIPNSAPRELGSLLLKWVADERFGVMTLGLGALKIIDDIPHQNIPDDNWDIMKYALPLLFIDQREVIDSENPRTTGRAITGDLQKSRNTKFPARQCKFESYDQYPKSPIKLQQENLVAKLAPELSVAICGPSDTGQNKNRTANNRHPNFNSIRNSIGKFLKWLSEVNIEDNDYSIIHLYGSDKEIYLSADTVIFEPLKVNSQSNKEGCFCKICLSRRPKTHIEGEINCVHCSTHSLDIIDLEKPQNKSDENRALGYLKERISPWHKLVKEFDQGDKTLAVYRAEEHTAQISEIANEEDGYTKTEIHELMFMDIPIQTMVQETGIRYQQPPIDILSCTTTMEVGIDLGNLNAVALRTVPPHASNYQQRVGRAGRGSSEVSVCMTWVDNSSYAQEFFRNPEQLVTNPKDPPSLYLNNRKIRQRHMNAILFQRFFKKPSYDPENLTFDGMQEGAGQLLESLGTLEQFITEKGHYGMKKFLGYLNDLRNGLDDDEKKIILAVSKTDEDEFDKWSADLSESVNEWKNLAISEDEPEEDEEND